MLAEQCRKCVYAGLDHKKYRKFGDVDLWFAQTCKALKKSKTAELKEKGYEPNPWSDFAARKETKA